MTLDEEHFCTHCGYASDWDGDWGDMDLLVHCRREHGCPTGPTCAEHRVGD